VPIPLINGIVAALLEWVEACRAFLKRKIAVFAFPNIHCAGHGPATVRVFLELFEKKKS
jgi:hypothetical protein